METSSPAGARVFACIGAVIAGLIAIGMFTGGKPQSRLSDGYGIDEPGVQTGYRDGDLGFAAGRVQRQSNAVWRKAPQNAVYRNISAEASQKKLKQ